MNEFIDLEKLEAELRKIMPSTERTVSPYRSAKLEQLLVEPDGRAPDYDPRESRFSTKEERERRDLQVSEWLNINRPPRAYRPSPTMRISAITGKVDFVS